MALPALTLFRPVPQARARLFAFPHAGGGASSFAKLRNALVPSHIELCALQAPGRENRLRDPAHANVEAMADEFFEAIQSLPPLPHALLGHSFGGLVAYLTAQRLEARGLAPERLIASGSVSPVRRTHKVLDVDADDFRQRVEALGGIPETIVHHSELLGMFLDVIKADIRLSDAYVQQNAQRLKCPITVYVGADDRSAPPEGAVHWQAVTEQPLRVRTFAGGHFFLHADANITADALLQDLGWTA